MVSPFKQKQTFKDHATQASFKNIKIGAAFTCNLSLLNKEGGQYMLAFKASRIMVV